MPRWRPFEPYFWSLVRTAPGGCWEWQGDTCKGYGRIWRDGKRQAAHRVSYELNIGLIPNGMYACHHCDNRRCVNPSHIFIGTAKDNMQDWTRKGKNTLVNHPELLPRGKDHWTQKKTKKTKTNLLKMAAARKQEWKDGKRKALRNHKGRIMGTRMVVI